MALLKLPGPLLTSKFKGIIDVIPLKWRSKLGLTSLVRERAVDVDPDALGDTTVDGVRVVSSVQQERTDERKKTDVFITDPVGSEMVEYFRTKDGQVGTRTHTVRNEGDTLPSFTELIIEADQEAWGDGLIEQIVSTIPNLLGLYDYKVERPDRVPADFGALLATIEESHTVAGTAALPTLGTGELMREERQIDDQTKRVTVRYRDLASLPKTIVNKDTSNTKLVVTITRIWELDSTTPAVPTATQDVSFEKLGDGTAIETRKVTTVFPGPIYGVSVENLIPPKFRAKIPTKTSEITSTGIVDTDPVLATGEISHEEQQIDVFNKRVKSVFFSDLELPVTKFDYETGEEFGGGILKIAYTLDLTSVLLDTVATGVSVVKASNTDLGNGYSVLETHFRKTTPWPPLDGQDYDERLDVILPFTQQVVDVGTNLGDPRTEIKPIDEWRQQNRTIDISAIETILTAFVLSYPTKVNIDMPDLLVGLESVIESITGEGAQDETGTIAFTGDYSISMSLRATAQSSATLLPDIIPDIKQFWGNNVDGTVFQFFLASPIVPADVLTKLAALIGGSVLAWPKYNPETVTLKTVGQRLSLQVVATSQGSAAVSGSGSSSTAAGGTGLSQEAGLTLKTTRISPTIHAEITVSGDTSNSAMISATATAEATGLGPAEDSTESGTVNAAVTPTTIPATVGAVIWPTTGKFLYRVDAEPYRYGFVQFHCIVVNAADFPNN